MKRFLLLVLFVQLAAFPAEAAIASTAVWEIRTTGLDTNGGCFDSALGGTDYSQQNAAQLTLTDITSNASGTTWTSATGGFTSAMVGNCVYLASGTGFTSGFYEIVGFTSSTQVTVDRDSSTTSSPSAGNIKVGGALLTIQTALTNWTVNGMSAYVKAGTYSISTGLTTAAGPTFTAKNRLIGYNTTRNDNPGYGNSLARPVIQTSAAITALTISQSGYSIENLEFDGNSTGTTAINANGDYGNAHNVKLRRFTGTCFTTNKTYINLLFSELTACGGAAVTNAGSLRVQGSWIHDNTGSGIANTGSQLTAIGNIISNNTGASSDGITDTWGAFVVGNTIHGNGRDGIRLINNYPTMSVYQNNLITSNTGYAINMTSAAAGGTLPAVWAGVNHNAVFNNGTNAYNNIAAGVGDVTLSACPYGTFSSTCTVTANDFSLNDTPGAGAACRSVGFPGLFAGTSGGTAVTSYRDLGAVQHADPVGGGGGTRSYSVVK